MTPITYPSAQAAFNRVYERVLAQGAPSILGESDSIICLYHSKAGACALGHLTDDVEQRKEWDQQAFSAGVVSDYFLIEGIGAQQAEFFHDLQHAHDEAARSLSVQVEPFLEGFKFRMKAVAKKWGLALVS